MPFVIGVVLALATGLFGKVTRFDGSKAFYPMILIVVGHYYVLFAAMAGPASALWAEIAFFAAFAAVAVIGFRRSLWLVAGGLLAHGLLDSVHPLLIDNPGAPAWWPAFCGAFDVAIAGVMAAWLWTGRNAAAA